MSEIVKADQMASMFSKEKWRRKWQTEATRDFPHEDKETRLTQESTSVSLCSLFKRTKLLLIQIYLCHTFLWPGSHTLGTFPPLWPSTFFFLPSTIEQPLFFVSVFIELWAEGPVNRYAERRPPNLSTSLACSFLKHRFMLRTDWTWSATWN